jgi:hypothetical protein
LIEAGARSDRRRGETLYQFAKRHGRESVAAMLRPRRSPPKE